MQLSSISAKNLRNLRGGVRWGKYLNVIFGENGQGKTNWLEAIFLLSTTKSFRTQHLNEAIRFGEESAVIIGQIERQSGVLRDVRLEIQNNSKRTEVNGKRVSATSFVSQLNVVAFTADELAVIRGGPEFRRRFLDRGTAGIHPPFIRTLNDYNRVIKQKNRILRDSADRGLAIDAVAELLDPWNVQLVALGTAIHSARLDYVGVLSEHLEHSLFGREELSIRYHSSMEGKGDLTNYRQVFSDRLGQRIQAELATGYSLIGPHRDDLEILFDGRDMRTFGSSGQQRSALLLLDLAAVSVYYSTYDEYPVFLIDDVDAEIDRRRIGCLLEYLGGRTQTFITTSKESLVEQFVPSADVFEIRDGMLAAKSVCS